MDMRFSFSPAEVAKVRMVQFGILSPDEIVNPSSLEYFLSLDFPVGFLRVWSSGIVDSEIELAVRSLGF